MTNIKAGIYSLTITDHHDCIIIDTVHVEQPTEIMINITTDSASCNGYANAYVFANPSGGTPGIKVAYTYLWSNDSTLSHIDKVLAGVYSLTVTDANNCPVVSTVNVPQPNPLGFTAKIHNVTCNGGNDGSAALTITGGSKPYKLVWLGGPANKTDSIYNMPAGQYFFEVTDRDSCKLVTSVTITQPNPISINFTLGNSDCKGTNGSWAKAVVSGGTAPYKYIWNTGAIIDSIVNLKTGRYFVTVTDKNKCTFFDSVYVSSLKAQLVVDNGCHNQNNAIATLTPIGGSTPYKFVWNNSTCTGTVSPLAQNGTYSVTLTDALGCFYDTTFTISDPPVFSATYVNKLYNGFNEMCYGDNDGMITVNASGGVLPYTYTWTPNAPDFNINNNIPAGPYTVVVTDKNNCPFTIHDTLSQPDSLHIDIRVISVKCSPPAKNTGSAEAFVTGGVPPYTYAWSNGNNTNFDNNIPLGNYTLNITDKNTCKDKQTVSLSHPLTIIDSVVNVKCNGEATGAVYISVQGGTSPYTYSWTGAKAETTQNLVNAVAGNYNILVTDSLGCSTNPGTAVSVTQPNPFTFNINNQPIRCNGVFQDTVTMTVNGNNPPYTYIWSNNVSSDQIINVNPGLYKMTVTDKFKCTATDSATVVQPQPLSIKIDSSNIKCNGIADGWISDTIKGGTKPYSFKWTYNGSAYSTNQNITGLAVGQYLLTVTDKNFCQLTRTVNIANISGIDVQFKQQNLLCNNIKTGWIKANVSGGAPTYSYLWSNGKKTDSIFQLPATIYVITVTDQNNCQVVTPVTLTQPDSIKLSFDSKNVICFGDSTGYLAVHATGGTPFNNNAKYIYKWSNGATVDSIFKLDSKYYVVSVTDNNNCVMIDSVKIKQNTQIIVKTANLVNICYKDTAHLSITSVTGGIPFKKLLPSGFGYKFKWNNSALLTSDTVPNPAAFPDSTTIFTVTVTDSLGCQVQFAVTVKVNSQIIVNNGPGLSSCNRSPVTLHTTVTGGTPGI